MTSAIFRPVAAARGRSMTQCFDLLPCVFRLDLRAHCALRSPRFGGVSQTRARPGGSAAGCCWTIDWFRTRVRAARDVAEHAVIALRAIGWLAWRHSHAWTVVLDAVPPDTVVSRWGLPVSQGRAHLVCTPGVDRALVDAFVADLPTRPILETSA